MRRRSSYVRRLLSRCAALAPFALAVSTPSIARADDTSDLQGLLGETVVTTASKSAEVGSTAPATSSTVTAEDLRRYGIHSLDEALDFLALGVVTQNTLHGADIGSRGVMLPGDRGSHYLLLINGHAMNEPVFGSALFDRGLGIPMEIVDHIEVVLGPGSVLYGSNAMLGVINVVTRRAKDAPIARVWSESEVGKSWKVGGAAAFDFKLGETPAEVSAALEYYRQDGPSLYFRPQNAGIDNARLAPDPYSRSGPANGVWGGNANATPTAEAPLAFARFVAGNFELNVHATTYKRAAPYNVPDFQAYTYFDDPLQYELDRHAFVDAKYRAQLSRTFIVTARGYGDTFDYQRYADTSNGSACGFASAAACRFHELGISRWAGAELQASWDWFDDARLVTLFGVDGKTRYVANKADVLDYDTGAHLASSVGVFEATDNIVGAYLQQTWNPVRGFDLNGGARVDYDPRFDPVGSPRAAAAVQPWRGGTLKLVYAEAFRAPSWGETSYTTPTQIAGSALRPEIVRSIEGSLEQRHGAHRIFAGVFRSWWSDMIELHHLSPDEVFAAQAAGQIPLTSGQAVTQYRNVASIDQYGFDFGTDGAFGDGATRYGLNLTGAASTRGADPQTASRPLTVTPRIFGNARISHDLPGDWPVIALATQLVGQRPADRAFDVGFNPAPYANAMLQLRATISGDVPHVRGLSYRLSANWASASIGPYVVGPQQDGVGGPASYTQIPIDTFRATVGLQYEIGR